MSDGTAKDFARCGRALVVAPAGCGKTHLIAQAVSYSPGRELVLTHTHAGVDSLRRRLKDLRVPSGKYRVTTIDSLALSFANAFPNLAGWTCPYPEDQAEWRGLREAARRLFSCRAPLRVLKATYDGVFVDEYQDCCGSQHALVTALAEVIPCRIVGDPLQAIFKKLHRDDVVRWREVEATFPLCGKLGTPHRWRKQNPKLGEWLGDVRRRLKLGIELDLSGAPGIIEYHPSADTQEQIKKCYRSLDKQGLVAICHWPDQCVATAEKTRNKFTVLESVECPDLLKASDAIANSSGMNRLSNVVKLAQACFTGMTAPKELLERLKRGDQYSPRSQDKRHLWGSMCAVLESDDFSRVDAMLLDIENLSGDHFFRRRELWCEMRRALRAHAPGAGKSLRKTAWEIRDHARQNGHRILSQRIVATPLLIKGLEFNHALVLDAAQMETAEELYVALTRGAVTLAILSNKPKVIRALPDWMAEREQ